MYRSVTTTERKLCDNQSQSPHLSGVNRAALGGVDAGGNDAGVAENVRKAAQVFFQRVKGAGEQVPQTMGEHLFWRDSGALAQGLHVPPDIASVQGLARPGGEYRPGGLFCFRA